MQIAVLGTGDVGKTIAGKLSVLGKAVFLGTRDREKSLAQTDKDAHGTQSLSSWLEQRQNISLVTFSEAVSKSDLIFLAVSGQVALPLLATIKPDAFTGKILIDLTNPLDFSQGMPPTLSIVNDDSLGERIQALLPKCRVVKTLNTVAADLMVNPQKLGPDHTMTLAGNDMQAKTQVREILESWFGWKDVIDLGDISQARGMEMYLPLWLRLWGALGTAKFNFKIVRQQ